MSITEKLIKRFKTLPTDFTFEELEKLLNFLVMKDRIKVRLLVLELFLKIKKNVL